MELVTEIRDIPSEIKGLSLRNLRAILTYLEEIDPTELQSL